MRIAHASGGASTGKVVGWRVDGVVGVEGHGGGGWCKGALSRHVSTGGGRGGEMKGDGFAI